LNFGKVIKMGEAMMALTIADMALLNMGKKMEHLRGVYS